MSFYLAPHFLERLNVFEEVTAGGTTSFRCSYSAHPDPEVVWFKDDLKIFTDERLTFTKNSTENETVLCLTVTRTKKEDEGAYRCTVENSEGVASTTGYLSVSDLSTRITDSEPIDQSLIDSLLLKSSQNTVDDGNAIFPPPTNSSHLENNFPQISGHSLDIDSIVTRIFADSVEIEKPNKSNANVPKPRVDQNLEVENSKKQEDNKNIVNIFTLMNSDNNTHDSFKPIEITKLNSSKLEQHIPGDDVNTLRKTADDSNGRSSISSGNGELFRTTSDMNYENIHQCLDSTLSSPPKQSVMDEINDCITAAVEAKRISEEMVSAEYGDGEKRNRISGDYDEIVKKHPMSIFSESNRMEREDNFSGEHSGSSATKREKLGAEFHRNGREKVSAAKHFKTPSCLHYSFSNESEKVNKTKQHKEGLKWLKVSHESLALSSPSDSQRGQHEKMESIMSRKKTNKPERKVCYTVNQTESNDTDDHYSTAIVHHPTQETPQPSASVDADKTEPRLTWNNALTSLFQFPRVLSVFFILTATMTFLYLEVNPLLVTIIVSALWCLVIYILSTTSNMAWKKA